MKAFGRAHGYWRWCLREKRRRRQKNRLSTMERMTVESGGWHGDDQSDRPRLAIDNDATTRCSFYRRERFHRISSAGFDL